MSTAHASTDARPAAPRTAAPEPVGEIEAMPWDGLVARYRFGVENFDPRMFELSDDQLDTPFKAEAGAGLWPVRVLLGHLADAEITLVHRMRRAVGEDHPVVAVWDEDSFVDAGMYGGSRGSMVAARLPIGGSVAVVHTLRRWHADWLGALSDPGRDRRVMHPERGPETVRRMLAYATWHVEHHAAYLNRKIGLLLGPSAPQPAKGGCCGGCGCQRP